MNTTPITRNGPAFIADAIIADTITYTTQTLDTTTQPPVVIDHTHTTTIVDIVSIREHNRTIVVWLDANGVTHRNAANYHIIIDN